MQCCIIYVNLLCFHIMCSIRLWYIYGTQEVHSVITVLTKINKYFTIGYNHINKYLLIVPPHVYDLIFLQYQQSIAFKIKI